MSGLGGERPLARRDICSLDCNTWFGLGHLIQSSVVVELRYVDSSPSFDAGSSTLVYQVCGLRLDDPSTLMPLPDVEQVTPQEHPGAQDRFNLFIDPFGGMVSSDRRLKLDIHNVVRSPSGIPEYTFQYRSDPSGTLYHGTMAQDLLATHPNAVLLGKDGFYRVRYDLIDVGFYPERE